jgi:hypothetical protein
VNKGRADGTVVKASVDRVGDKITIEDEKGAQEVYLYVE